MVKLEELKVGDIVYEICGYHWVSPRRVEEEPFYSEDIQSKVIKCSNINGKPKIKHYLQQEHEINLFRTENEARNTMKEFRNKQKEEWKNKDELIKWLYNRSLGTLTKEQGKLIIEIITENEKEIIENE